VADTAAVRCDLDGDAEPDPTCHTLLVGPEGGWSDDERAARPQAIALADTVLRTETAAVAAAVTLMSFRRSRHGRAAKAS
jgi:RsmE family RNA methyltransferase